MKVIGALIGVLIAAVVLSLPLAFAVMLAAGNLGVHLSFLGSIPVAIVIGAIGGTKVSQ